MPLNAQQSADVLAVFPDADLLLIDDIVYFDGWASYEEAAGMLIFRAIDGTLQRADYGHCVMASVEDQACENAFTLTEISEETAAYEIAEMVAQLEASIF
jgi:hypothetical protein